MESWTKPVVVMMVIACGTDQPVDKSPYLDSGIGDTAVVDDCEQSVVSYDNFGHGFMNTWCAPCHSSALQSGAPGEDDPRSGAPEGVDLDTHAGVQDWSERILARSTGDAPSMPPVGGPTLDDLALLEEWLLCGALE